MEGIALEHVVVDPDGPANGWTAVLALDGRALADISGDGVSLFSVRTFRDGTTEADMAALDHAVRATADPTSGSDGRQRVETLADRVADLVATSWVSTSVGDLLAKGAVGTMETDGVVGIVRVPVPRGGTLDDAVAFLAETHPTAVILNRLPPDEAVSRYVAALPG